MLEKLIKDRALDDRVILVGKSNQIDEWMQRSNLFCLPSQWDGFPNAPGEALAHGLPVVGFSECEDVNKLIEHGRNVLLAPGRNDYVLLSKALETLMRDNRLRAIMGAEAVNSSLQFEPQEVFSSWNELLSSFSRAS